MFLALFDCPRQNINHSSEKLKVIYIKRFFLFCAIINYQYKTSELKDAEKLWWSKQFKPFSPVRMNWECAFLYDV